MTTPPFADPIETVRELWRTGESKRIEACYILAGEVGNYDGMTALVAERLSVDPDTVLKMERAGKVYRDLLERDEDFAQEVKDLLAYSHLNLVGKYRHVAVLLDGQDAEYLRIAIDEGLSVRRLDQRIRKDFELIVEPEFVDTIKRYINRLDADLITTHYGGLGSKEAEDFAAQQVRPAAAALLETLQELEGMIDNDK